MGMGLEGLAGLGGAGGRMRVASGLLRAESCWRLPSCLRCGAADLGYLPLLVGLLPSNHVCWISKHTFDCALDRADGASDCTA